MHLLLSLSRISISQMSTFSISFSTRTNPAELNQNNLNIKQFDSDVKQFLTYSSTRSLPLFFRKPALLLFTFFGFFTGEIYSECIANCLSLLYYRLRVVEILYENISTISFSRRSCLFSRLSLSHIFPLFLHYCMLWLLLGRSD